MSNLPLIIANNITDEEQKIAANKFIHFTRGFKVRQLFVDDYDFEDKYPNDCGYIKLFGSELSLHMVALKNDGSVFTISNGYHSQKNDSPIEKGFIDISCGYYHTVGLKEDGSIVTWGSDIYNQIKNSPNDKNYIAIATGCNHCIALTNNGALVMWGQDDYNSVRLDFPDDKGYIQMDSGPYHGVALKQDGSISIWGGRMNDNGELVPESRFCPDDKGYVDIACKADNTIALKNDNSFVIFDSNSVVYQGIKTNKNIDLKKILYFYENNKMNIYQIFISLHRYFVDMTCNSNEYFMTLKKEGDIWLNINHENCQRIHGLEYDFHQDEMHQKTEFFSQDKFVALGSCLCFDLGLQYSED